MFKKLDTGHMISALWMFVLLNIIFRDIHQFALKSHLEMLLTGYYDGILITEELMLLGGFLALVPISMTLFSLIMTRKFARPLNFAGVLITAGTFATSPPTDMDDVLHLTVTLIAMAVILWKAWNWPREAALA
jgi:hypothetical protein